MNKRKGKLQNIMRERGSMGYYERKGKVRDMNTRKGKVQDTMRETAHGLI